MGILKKFRAWLAFRSLRSEVVELALANAEMLPAYVAARDEQTRAAEQRAENLLLICGSILVSQGGSVVVGADAVKAAEAAPFALKVEPNEDGSWTVGLIEPEEDGGENGAGDDDFPANDFAVS
jgi:hypothetical protein